MMERLNGGIYDQILKLEEVVMRSCNHVINLVISATADDNQHAFIRCFVNSYGTVGSSCLWMSVKLRYKCCGGYGFFPTDEIFISHDVPFYNLQPDG